MSLHVGQVAAKVRCAPRCSSPPTIGRLGWAYRTGQAAAQAAQQPLRRPPSLSCAKLLQRMCAGLRNHEPCFIQSGPAALPVLRQWCRAGMICVALSLVPFSRSTLSSRQQQWRWRHHNGSGPAAGDDRAQRLGAQQLGDAARPAASVRRRRCRAAAGSWTEDRVAARWRLNL